MNDQLSIDKKYNRLSVSGKKMINDYKLDGDKDKLFNSINNYVEKYTNESTKYTKRALFRGLLKSMGFTFNDIISIGFAEGETKNYNSKVNSSAIADKSLIIVTDSVIKELMNYPPTLLYLTSGRRYSELKENPLELRDGNIWMVIDKKKNRDMIKIKTLINPATWYELYKNTYMPHNSSLYNKMTVLLRELKLEKHKGIHILRAIYIRLIDRFYNSHDLTFSVICMTYLNHDCAKNISYYDHIQLDKNVEISSPFLPIESNKCVENLHVSIEIIPKIEIIDYSKYTCDKLRVLCKERKFNGFSKFRKSELIALLSK